MEPWFDEKEAKAVYKYLQGDGWITEYTKTGELEDQIAKFTGARYCVMTVNGTVSLILALLALEITQGDEVLVPDLTMIATPNAASLLGIKPVLVDVDPDTFCMNMIKAHKAITHKTKAVMYVSLNGRSGDMKQIKKFCKEHHLYLIEDSAQSLGSYFGKKHLGTFGEIGTLSFASPKIITTGQGGALLTNSSKLYHKIKKLKDFGRVRGGIDIHDDWGWNFKFTDLQSIIGLEQMKKLPQRLKRKKEIYKKYTDGLKEIEEISFIPTNVGMTTPWSIDVYLKSPPKLAEYLKRKGIGTRTVYPAIHTQKIYRNKKYKGEFPVASEYARTGLWLPSSSKLTDDEVEYIISNIRWFYGSK